MKNQKKRYSEQFRKDAVRLLLNRGTKTIPEVARSIGVSQSMLYRWRELYGDELRNGNGRAQTESEEGESLRRRLRELEQENALLKKAAALFAKDVR